MEKIVSWSYSRLNNFEQCPKKFWHLSVQKDFKETESEDMKYGKKLHKALEMRIGHGRKLPSEFSYLEPIAAKFADAAGTKLVEQQMAINDSFEPVEWFAKNAWCRSIVDLAIISPPRAVIVDWKTGKQSNDFTQQRLAAAMFFLFHPEVNDIDLMYYWIKDRQHSVQSLSRNDAKHVWRPLVDRVRHYTRAHMETRFPPRPSGLCKKHCPVKDCPHYGVG